MGYSPKKDLERFLAEDIGKGDITSALLPKKKIFAQIISREKGIVAGTKYAKQIFALKKCQVKIKKTDGSKINSNDVIMEISGNADSVLSCERTSLNLLSRMCGIATQTNDLVRLIGNNKAKLFATRKTAPGLRYFDKEAVSIGGGFKHRMRLDDMVMIKDNHIEVGDSLVELIRKARKKHKKIEVEVENQKDALIAAKEHVSIIMLDNFLPNQIKKTINILEKNGLRKKVKLEASGGISEKNIKSYAMTGVDIISIGSITNSVNGLDLSLEVKN